MFNLLAILLSMLSDSSDLFASPRRRPQKDVLTPFRSEARQIIKAQLLYCDDRQHCPLFEFAGRPPPSQGSAWYARHRPE